MICPACGNNQAFQGFTSIDCPTPDCRYYQGAPSTENSGSSSYSSNPGPTSSGSTTQGYPAPQITGSTGTATLNLRIDLTSTIKRNSVLISLVAHGDPGIPNKNVEISWTVPGMLTPRICTLSGRNAYLLTGIDADGKTTYNTHWQCTLDGVKPTDPWTLTARIF